jgi:nitric oxide reductase activation protein
MSVSSISTASASVAQSSQSSTSLNAKAAKTAAQQFQEYASMTPAQRLHAEMLAKLGLTEDQFKALPPAQQQKVEQQIADMIKKQMANNNDTRPGMITDKTA